jgi:putative transposase
MARVVLPGVWHHVTHRGNHHQDVFLDDTDRRQYLHLLGRHCAKHGVSLTGYCLMGNHVHLLAIPSRETSLAQALGRAHNDYARWFHLRRGETGHLWQNRYFSCPLDKPHQWEALRYIELNPVRAGLVAAPELWPWSSARAHLGRGDPGAVVDMVEWRAVWSPDTWEIALAEGVTNAALVERIRQATRTGRPLGTDRFVKEAETFSGRRLRPNKRGPKLSPAAAANQLELEVWQTVR